jgi:hypothetical protein
MKKEQVLPSILILIDIAAAMGYIPSNNFRMVIYWLAAAALTTTVTF